MEANGLTNRDGSKRDTDEEDCLLNDGKSSHKLLEHYALPKWLQDNAFIVKGYRPPLYSYTECFKSIFQLHTETGNIWTHLIGFVLFIGLAIHFLLQPSYSIQFAQKVSFSFFFAGAIICLGFSTTYHTLHCHSPGVGHFFQKLDYCGIAILITGSFIPWLYYGFMCFYKAMVVYTTIVVCLGITAVIVSLHSKFGTPRFRPLRAAVFLTFGLSGIIPGAHYILLEGIYEAFVGAGLGWLILHGALYVVGALMYAMRIPERFFPGKCDLWFQSHQIFHVLVVLAALVHYYGMSGLVTYRESHPCDDALILHFDNTSSPIH